MWRDFASSPIMLLIMREYFWYDKIYIFNYHLVFIMAPIYIWPFILYPIWNPETYPWFIFFAKDPEKAAIFWVDAHILVGVFYTTFFAPLIMETAMDDAWSWYSYPMFGAFGRFYDNWFWSTFKPYSHYAMPVWVLSMVGSRIKMWRDWDSKDPSQRGKLF